LPHNPLNKHYPVLATPDAALLPWLTHAGSLTAKLEGFCKHSDLTVLSQTWKESGWWANYHLGLVKQRVLERTITLSAKAVPCWFARTLVPLQTYNAHQELFERLRNESLGDIIFSEPAISRLVLCHYPITPHCIEFQWLPAAFAEQKTVFWARLSVYTIACNRFYLIEILLPGLLRAIDESV
jgi:chorismate--pyruvate lyase